MCVDGSLIPALTVAVATSVAAPAYGVRNFGGGLRWDRKDDDFSGLGGVDNGNRCRADLGRQRGQALRSARVRNRDVMTQLGEAARKNLSHVSSADDSDSHVDSL
jgi:hypothetical protein